VDDDTPQTEPTSPPCVACEKRPRVDPLQTCTLCAHSIDRDLIAWPDLVVLLPAAVAPSLQLWREPGARSGDESPLPGGEALNLTGGGSANIVARLIPHLRTVRTVREVPVDGQKPLLLESWTRDVVLDDDGRPVLIPDGDQYGNLPPAVVMAQWVTEWAILRDVGERGGQGSGWLQAPWLRERLDWALRDHPDLAAFAAELRQYVGTMRRLLGLQPYRQRYPDPCPRCDNVGTCTRIVDPMDTDDTRAGHITCGYPTCGTMWTLDEWQRRLDDAKELAA
jgi:hypothetical protein